MKFVVNSDNLKVVERKSSRKYLSRTDRDVKISKCPSFSSNLKIDENVDMEKCFEDVKVLSKVRF